MVGYYCLVELTLINSKHLGALGALACGLIPHHGKDLVHRRASYTHIWASQLLVALCALTLGMSKLYLGPMLLCKSTSLHLADCQASSTSLGEEL
jgi:hypothetical protein